MEVGVPNRKREIERKERAREAETDNVKNENFFQLPILNVNWISRKKEKVQW